MRQLSTPSRWHISHKSNFKQQTQNVTQVSRSKCCGCCSLIVMCQSLCNIKICHSQICGVSGRKVYQYVRNEIKDKAQDMFTKVGHSRGLCLRNNKSSLNTASNTGAIQGKFLLFLKAKGKQCVKQEHVCGINDNNKATKHTVTLTN